MDQSTMLNMLLEAYRDEREADAFYTALLAQADDYEVVEALAEARRDEREHARMIRDLILSIAEGPPQEITPKLPSYGSLEDAIRIAMADERQAVEFYGQIINSAQDIRIRDTFITIREDEIVHALKFEALLNEMQEDKVNVPGPKYPEL